MFRSRSILLCTTGQTIPHASMLPEGDELLRTQAIPDYWPETVMWLRSTEERDAGADPSCTNIIWFHGYGVLKLRYVMKHAHTRERLR